MDSWELLQFIQDVAPSITILDGYVFLNRNELSPELLRDKISEYKSISDAQYWINLVPIDDYLSKIVDGWSTQDKNVDAIASVYRRSWLALCALAGVSLEALSVECLTDTDTGDVAIQLKQKSH